MEKKKRKWPKIAEGTKQFLSDFLRVIIFKKKKKKSRKKEALHSQKPMVSFFWKFWYQLWSNQKSIPISSSINSCKQEISNFELSEKSQSI